MTNPKFETFSNTMQQPIYQNTEQEKKLALRCLVRNSRGDFYQLAYMLGLLEEVKG